MKQGPIIRGPKLYIWNCIVPSINSHSRLSQIFFFKKKKENRTKRMKKNHSVLFCTKKKERRIKREKKVCWLGRYKCYSRVCYTPYYPSLRELILDWIRIFLFVRSCVCNPLNVCYLKIYLFHTFTWAPLHRL